MIDTHTHTQHSFDGRATDVAMAERGKELGLEYMAFTDHYDRDYVYIPAYSYVKQMDVAKYISDIEKMKEHYPFLALGIELGYSKKAEEDYCRLPFEKFDTVLNSIHTVDELDAYNPEYFEHKTREEAYEKYLIKVCESVDAKYYYNTITHIGFVRKNSTYDTNEMPLAKYSDIVDGIFKKIIEKGKTLEVNSNIKTKDFMPTKEFLKRYYELGGRSISFASDAHVVSRVGEMYREACEIVKNVGFKYWTVYRQRKPIFMEID